ncbi:Uncharacterized protein dnm_070610 [Desulfonema magnum]|uniref:Uncharacterized protein n=1 Tax=Desulfonema magnum TaxID=45655 RepID=A0A975BSN4_9BACT|nr:Uncharacterized protein dnm_070610 [Desulfonema magnum]
MGIMFHDPGIVKYQVFPGIFHLLAETRYALSLPMEKKKHCFLRYFLILNKIIQKQYFGQFLQIKKI